MGARIYHLPSSKRWGVGEERVEGAGKEAAEEGMGMEEVEAHIPQEPVHPALTLQQQTSPC
jgi:hypothetical protein